MKVLNLYAGIGGNRTHWKNCEVTAVERNVTIAAFYKKRFPKDTVIVGDAHEYLLKNFRQFDRIWSSHPCQSHSRARFWSSRNSETVQPIYPELTLYEEILFLRHYFDGDWIVENVVPFYEPLIHPQVKVGRHLFWSNRALNANFKATDLDIKDGTRGEYEAALGITLGDHRFDTRTDQILRNCVHPDVGQQLFEYFDRFTVDNQPTLWS